jgi:hypothetical protein
MVDGGSLEDEIKDRQTLRYRVGPVLPLLAARIADLAPITLWFAPAGPSRRHADFPKTVRRAASIHYISPRVLSYSARPYSVRPPDLHIVSLTASPHKSSLVPQPLAEVTGRVEALPPSLSARCPHARYVDCRLSLASAGSAYGHRNSPLLEIPSTA